MQQVGEVVEMPQYLGFVGELGMGRKSPRLCRLCYLPISYHL